MVRKEHQLRKNIELAVCEMCLGGEGSLPTDCPGVGMPSELQDKVYSGETDFRLGRGWVKPNGSGTSMGDMAVRQEANRARIWMRDLALGPKSHELVRRVLSYPGFEESPGGKTRHHDFWGGLVVHTVEVMGYASEFSVGAEFPTEWALVAAAWHDLGKVHAYRFEDDGSISKNQWEERIGHVAWSWAQFDRAAEEVELDEVARYEIGHAMLAHHGRLEWRSPVEPKTALAHVLHAADMCSMQAAGGGDKKQ